MLPFYLTGVSNDYTCEAAETDLYGRLGILLQPGTLHHAGHIPSYCRWAMDNGCFSTGGAFDGEAFVRSIDSIVQNVESAHEKCLFAVAPDVFNPDEMKGDPRATIERSMPWFKRIREAGVPVAFVAQDGLQHLQSEIPWPEFDVMFLGGSDEFKLGYPSKRVNGNPHFATDGNGATSADTLAWARMIQAAHDHEKPIHVGRVNAHIRLTFGFEIGAESCDGTFIKFGGRQNLDRIREWFRKIETGYEAALAEQREFAELAGLFECSAIDRELAA